MQFGFGILKLDPKTFWAMTPRELAAAHSALYQQAMPITRNAMAGLMRDFPDLQIQEKEQKNGRS